MERRAASRLPRFNALRAASGSAPRPGTRAEAAEPRATTGAPPLAAASAFYRKLGFTLIELMLVVAIIGLLAAIALPKFANLVEKSREAAVRGNLGALRGAFRLYLVNHEEAYPGSANVPGWTSLENWLIPQYIDAVPKASLPHLEGHGPSDQYIVLPDPTIDDVWATGGFAWHVYGPLVGGFVDPILGVRVNCTHTDSRGTIWSLY